MLGVARHLLRRTGVFNLTLNRMRLPPFRFSAPRVSSPKREWVCEYIAGKFRRVEYVGRDVRIPEFPKHEFAVVRVNSGAYRFGEKSSGRSIFGPAPTEQRAITRGMMRLAAILRVRGMAYLDTRICMFPPVSSLSDSAPTQTGDANDNIGPVNEPVEPIKF